MYAKDKQLEMTPQRIIFDMRVPDSQVIAVKDYIKDIHRSLLEGQK